MTSSSGENGWRIGIDLGGSKIEGILLSPDEGELARYRVATPRNDYAATIAAIVDLAARLMQDLPVRASARSKWKATRWTARYWRRMGSQPASMGCTGRKSRTTVLVRKERVLGNMGLGPWHGRGSHQTYGTGAYG